MVVPVHMPFVGVQPQMTEESPTTVRTDTLDPEQSLHVFFAFRPAFRALVVGNQPLPTSFPVLGDGFQERFPVFRHIANNVRRPPFCKEFAALSSFRFTSESRLAPPLEILRLPVRIPLD